MKMQKYELVLLLDAAVQDKERNEIVAKLETEIKDCIQQKDDMGLQITKYDLGGIRGNNKFYFMAYELKLDAEHIEKIKKALLYNKVVVRNFLFACKASDEFFAFDTLQKTLEKVIEGWTEKKMGQKTTFYTKPENEKYITWKSLPMLKKYMTRFGDIKPRKYTGNPVRIQKDLRIAIIRAREMGLLEYIK
jgi:ribosomal protein S18